MNKSVICFFFFFLQISGMILIPVEIIPLIESYLDDKSHMRFISTCKKLRSIYLSPSDYTDKMFLSARSYVLEQDEEKKKNHKEVFNGLMMCEGPINKLNRESVKNFFNKEAYRKNQLIIEIYGTIYDESNCIFDFQNEKAVDVIAKYSPEVFELLYKQDNRYHFNYLDKCKESVLCIFIRRNQVARVKLLLKLSSFLVSRKVKMLNHWSILSYAVWNSYNEIVKLLFDDSEIDVNDKGKASCAALYIATKKNNIECVKLLLTHPKIDINAQNQFGKTPLYIATKKNNIECVKLLVNDPRINGSVGDFLGYTPYYYAKDPQVKELLAKNTSWWGKYKYIFLYPALIGSCIVLGRGLAILVEIMYRAFV